MIELTLRMKPIEDRKLQTLIKKLKILSGDISEVEILSVNKFITKNL